MKSQKDYEQVLLSIRESVATITLNRPDRMNAWTSQMESEFRHAMEYASADENVRAIVITGSGRGFCAGADMSILNALNAGATEQPRTPDNAGSPTQSAGSDEGGLAANYQHRFSFMLQLPKPIFVAINGAIAGIGLCMALFSDFRYMVPGAKLTTAFARRGLVAEHGISWMLPRLVGPTNALDLLLSGRNVLTDEAARMGLVKELPAQDFLATVQNMARAMAAEASPRSIGVMKRQVWDSFFQNLDEAWRVADQEMVKSFSSEDFREGVAHFVERRPARFTGR